MFPFGLDYLNGIINIDLKYFSHHNRSVVEGLSYTNHIIESLMQIAHFKTYHLSYFTLLPLGTGITCVPL